MDFMIYGANGYTGELIAREAVTQGMEPVLAGRNAEAINALSRELGLPSRVFPLGKASEIARALQGINLVLNCAGPFSKTAFPMIEACLAANVHYLDITGEIEILEGVHYFDHEAKAAGVVLCPGTGFDVVPTDCIALMLKNAVPQASELALGFEVLSRDMSAGTAKTALEGFVKSGKVRRGGRIVDFPLGSGLTRIDFGNGEKLAMPIPWGDVASAYYTTHIPNITVYTPVSQKTALLARLSNLFAPILRSGPLRGWLATRIEKVARGPDAATRKATPSFVWGKATDAGGRSHEIRIKTLNGYSLTVYSALAIAQHLMTGACEKGCFTPAALMGEDFVLRLPGTALLAAPKQA